jgi:hypothetical protein
MGKKSHTGIEKTPTKISIELNVVHIKKGSLNGYNYGYGGYGI